MKKVLAAGVLAFTFCTNARADDLAYLLANLQGYTIIAVLNIEGYVDQNGKRGNDFEGCNFGRKIIFSGNKALTCQGYNYQYAYRPEAVILESGPSFKMIVDRQVYTMSRF